MIIRAVFLRLPRTIAPSLLFKFSDQDQQKYAERPWLRQPWLALNKKTTLKDVLHGAWLMSSGVIPFSYDTYLWACGKAIESQPQLYKQDLMMLMNLGVEYGVRLSPFSELIENQIFLRIHRDYELDMFSYDDQIKKQIQELHSKLELKSRDYFEILNEEDNEEGELVSQDDEEGDAKDEKITIPLETAVREESAKGDELTQQEQLLMKYNEDLTNRKTKEFSLEDILKVAELLQKWNSKNLQMIQYIQELLTIKLQTQQVQAGDALSYLRFLTFACQSLFSEYKDNKGKYTSRSIKRIYKYQYFYFQEHFRQLVTSDSTSSPEFLQEVIQQYASFPIKRRELRRKIGVYASSQMNRFSMTDRQDLIEALMKLNGKDEKMKKMYRSLLGLPEPEPKKELQHQSDAKGEQSGQSEEKKTQSLI